MPRSKKLGDEDVPGPKGIGNANKQMEKATENAVGAVS